MRLDENLREFNNRNPDKVHIYYQISDESKKKVWILLLVIIAISIVGSYFNINSNQKEKIKIEKVKK